MRAARLLTVSRSIPYILAGESAQPPGMQTPPGLLTGEGCLPNPHPACRPNWMQTER